MVGSTHTGRQKAATEPQTAAALQLHLRGEDHKASGQDKAEVRGPFLALALLQVVLKIQSGKGGAKGLCAFKRGYY